MDQIEKIDNLSINAEISAISASHSNQGENLKDVPSGKLKRKTINHSSHEKSMKRHKAIVEIKTLNDTINNTPNGDSIETREDNGISNNKKNFIFKISEKKFADVSPDQKSFAIPSENVTSLRKKRPKPYDKKKRQKQAKVMESKNNFENASTKAEGDDIKQNIQNIPREPFMPRTVDGLDFRIQLGHIFKSYKAAGVLPYRFNKENNKLELLLGQEIRRNSKTRSWCEFGGKKETTDRSVFDTVAREFSEETCGVLSGVYENPSKITLNSSIIEMTNLLNRCFPKNGKRYMQIAPNTYLSEHSVDTLSLQVYAPFAKYAIFVLPFTDVILPTEEVFQNCVLKNNDPEYMKSNDVIPEARKEIYKWFSLEEINELAAEDSTFLYPFFSKMLRILSNSITLMEDLHDVERWKVRELTYYPELVALSEKEKARNEALERRRIQFEIARMKRIERKRAKKEKAALQKLQESSFEKLKITPVNLPDSNPTSNSEEVTSSTPSCNLQSNDIQDL